MANFNSEHKIILDEMILDNPNVRPGKMFGYPAYYVSKKLSICLYEQGVGVKVPGKIAGKLLESDLNVAPFRPLGKPKMRKWIQINLTHSEDYRQYMPLFEESIRYLLSRLKK
jgi:hypothetical protein